MVINMTTQSYCMVNKQTNICDNTCIWDGNPNTWTPPSNYLMLVQAITPAKIWVKYPQNLEYTLVVQDGQGGIGFTWDGTYLITNEPQPIPPVGEQPISQGAQTL